MHKKIIFDTSAKVLANVACHSERSEESSFWEILRSLCSLRMTSDKGVFQRSLFMVSVASLLWFWLPEASAQKKEVKILPEKIVSKFQAGAIPITDPTSGAWLSLPAKAVKLIPQDVQEPKLAQPSITSINVRSLNNGSWIAFHIEWGDSSEDFNLRVDKYSDGVAVEFPLNFKQPPDHRMGSEKEPIHLLLWKASQQKANEGVSFLALNYPHRWSDYSPCELPGNPVSPACAIEIKELLPAVALGNPIVPGLSPSVEELYAETWNKVIVHEDQHATGKGVWKGKHWYVVIARPIITPDPQDAPLDGGSSYVAFACWDGNKDNQGPRKMVTEGWLGLEIGK
jgi:hypothetical protein